MAKSHSLAALLLRPAFALIATFALSTSTPAQMQAQRTSDQDISDAYIYLLGRLLVTRQQQLDFKEGFKWNELVHRKPGAVDWPNPNLDVAYSEAWVAVDESSCTIVSVPKVEGRYYTVHFLNGWGETIANINERLFPKRPFGEFAMCLRGANVAIPAGATRIDLPVKYSRVLARVELGSDPDAAIALQHQFRFRATGTPKLPEIPKTPIFELEALPGVEAFEAAEIALDSEPDLSVGLEALGEKARAIAKAVKDPAERARVDQVIRTRAFADIGKAAHVIGHGTVQNGWARPGVVGEYGLDYLARTLVNNGGIWANIKPEVLYYRGSLDQAGAELIGDNVYTLTFPKDRLARPVRDVLLVGDRRRQPPFPRAAQSAQPVSAQQPVEAAIRPGRLAHALLRRSEARRRARRQLAADAERAEVSPHVPVLPADGRRGERHLLSAAADQAVTRQAGERSHFAKFG